MDSPHMLDSLDSLCLETSPKPTGQLPSPPAFYRAIVHHLAARMYRRSITSAGEE